MFQNNKYLKLTLYFYKMEIGKLISIIQKDDSIKNGEIVFFWEKEKKYNVQYLDGEIEYKVPLNLLKIMNNDKIYERKESKPKPKPLKENQCDICRQEFNTYRGLERHKWENHPSNEYERAWANNTNKTGFYADDPYY